MVVYLDVSTNHNGVIIVAVLWFLSAFSGLFIGLRAYSKLSRNRQLWWDDVSIFVSWILLLLSASATTTNVRLGFGRPIREVPFENLVLFGIQSNISGFASVLAVLFSKASFALTLLRLADGWMKWFIIGLLVLLNITHYFGALMFWVSCNPPAKTWNPTIPGECWPSSVSISASLFVGACSAFCDFALALLPWRLLLRFNMFNKEKIGVAIAMSMGIFAGISCIVKMTNIPLLYDGRDFSYNALPLVIWGLVEPSVTIMAASIPVMRHLFVSRREDRDRPGTAATAASSSSSPSGNTSTTNPARDSIGGSRESRLAAIRANRHNAVDEINLYSDGNGVALPSEKGAL
ncbi:hypothetical protein VTI28DRAFT_8323 [Corynascus sepedonium]